MSDARVSFADGVDRDQAIERAAAILQRDGVVVLDDVVDPVLIDRCRAEIEAGYPEMERVDRERNYGNYEGRHTVPLRVEHALADPAIFLPRVVEKIATVHLGAAFEFDSIGLLVAVTGAPDQVRHADANLYPESPLDRMLPPFAIAYALPLVTMDAVSGRTAFWRGSHRKPDLNEAPDPDLVPDLKPGSAILWDFRVFHCGQANRGDRSRPVLFATLARDWWSEVVSHEATRYEKLLVRRSIHAALKPRLQRRLRRATLLD